MALDKQKQQARWRRNKRAQRLRLGSSKPVAPAIDPVLETQVWAERDRRLRNFPWDMPRAADGSHYKRRTYESTYPLICDVWAAETLINSQKFHRNITDGLIANFLFDRSKNHGLKKTSLRSKVYLARKIVRHLQTAPSRSFEGVYWPQFPQSVAEDGSGLIQHVNIVMQNLDIR